MPFNAVRRDSVELAKISTSQFGKSKKEDEKPIIPKPELSLLQQESIAKKKAILGRSSVLNMKKNLIDVAKEEGKPKEFFNNSKSQPSDQSLEVIQPRKR